ncbi:Alpha/beta hydrolase family protein [Enhygromyxa salina]|uniref:Alpha/beta hydrolase family protein n=1 Tax=Enhygromyxa salina TaxID=215803 RepID=A0A2S9XYE8_9BACT|nr:alpha/beta hydrolase [Enhygromyxa salina]PRP97876.1 Alpha/beta hydrolase family protein [Enhygromyxa salina]
MIAELSGYARGLARAPSLALDWRALPRGHAPVLVIPGFAAADASTLVIRGVLGRLGHPTHGWGLGRNHGNHAKLLPPLIERVAELAEAHAQPITLIGWSLGGMFAREATRAEPRHVAAIATLGTPVVGGGAGALGVPITAIYSKRDAVVPWQQCIDPNPANEVEYIEVDATHLELGVAPQVLKILASIVARSGLRSSRGEAGPA